MSTMSTMSTMKLYLFQHPDTSVAFGVLAHNRKEALDVLKREREDVHFIVHLYGIEPTVIDTPTLLYVEGVKRKKEEADE